jgi:ADP-ribose pyrophosphatase
MAGGRTVNVKSRKFVFDQFFKVEELVLSHQLRNGRMSPDQTRLVFERGDAVAVLLFNRDTMRVAAVKQFRAPAHGKSRDNGWVTEAIAGMIAQGETALDAAVRETLEETGYQISNPTHITTFFSSPGGSSERIFLYYAEVGDADKVQEGGGRGDEDIEILYFSPNELFEKVKSGAIEDPKLIIGSAWLQQQQNTRRTPLGYSTVRYAMTDRPTLIVGYKTGTIARVEGVDVWVNSENEDMMMDRFIGKTISANIRYLGAHKDRDNNVREDTIADALRKKLGRRLHVKIAEVIETGPGALAARGVRRILHVATVKGMGAGQGVTATLSDLARCTEEVLSHVHRENQGFWWRKFFRKTDESILIPMFGAGDGGLQVEQVADKIITQAVDFFRAQPTTTLKQIYFLAFGPRDRAACDDVLEGLRKNDVLVRVP